LVQLLGVRKKNNFGALMTRNEQRDFRRIEQGVESRRGNDPGDTGQKGGDLGGGGRGDRGNEQNRQEKYQVRELSGTNPSADKWGPHASERRESNPQFGERGIAAKSGPRSRKRVWSVRQRGDKGGPKPRPEPTNTHQRRSRRARS